MLVHMHIVLATICEERMEGGENRETTVDPPVNNLIRQLAVRCLHIVCNQI